MWNEDEDQEDDEDDALEDILVGRSSPTSSPPPNQQGAAAAAKPPVKACTSATPGPVAKTGTVRVQVGPPRAAAAQPGSVAGAPPKQPPTAKRPPEVGAARAPVAKVAAPKAPVAKVAAPKAPPAAAAASSGGSAPVVHGPLFGNFDISDEEEEDYDEDMRAKPSEKPSVQPKAGQEFRDSFAELADEEAAPPKLLQAKPKSSAISAATTRKVPVVRQITRPGAAAGMHGKGSRRPEAAPWQQKAVSSPPSFSAPLAARPGATKATMQRSSARPASPKKNRLLASALTENSSAPRLTTASKKLKEKSPLKKQRLSSQAAPWRKSSAGAHAEDEASGKAWTLWSGSKRKYEQPSKSYAQGGAAPKKEKREQPSTLYAQGAAAPKKEKKQESSTSYAQGPAAKKLRTVTTPRAAQVTSGGVFKDCFGREFSMHDIVVNFANVGHNFGAKVDNREYKKQQDKKVQLFDWEGVRRCLLFLKNEMKLKITGVVDENFRGLDNNMESVPLPEDIRKMCVSVQETPRVRGRQHGSADDEMTIKCAYRRNCRFLDNDNYSEWLVQMSDDKARTWLQTHHDFVHMRYYFDTGTGTFDVLGGNYPMSSLAKNENQDKFTLSCMGRG
eukprot:TRINITY_DN90519_c0_g1_i1.p1 TRINITY_DN90519_c0_g1~~TRINITY_DN90519_c0_g1_i1.p1  ORF type:complete len:628 (-),score=163.44 TRINITY_DN90519_c0_g1_i1:34-1881(-)